MKIERIYLDLIKHPKEEGFYKHPFMGIWLSKSDDRVLTPNGFVEPSTGGEYKYHIRRHIHVLKLETFLSKPEGIKVIGNHMNGVKHDNDLGNLEWVTHSGNLNHAYENGLRTDNLNGIIKDLETNVVMSFHSLAGISRYLGYRPANITRYLNSDRNVPIKFKYSIWLVGEKPSSLTKDDIGKVGKGSSRQLIAVESETGKIRYFGFIRNASKFFNLGYEQVMKAISIGKCGKWVLKEPSTFDEYILCMENDELLKSSKRKVGKFARKDDKLLAPQA